MRRALASMSSERRGLGPSYAALLGGMLAVGACSSGSGDDGPDAAAGSGPTQGGAPSQGGKPGNPFSGAAGALSVSAGSSAGGASAGNGVTSNAGSAGAPSGGTGAGLAGGPSAGGIAGASLSSAGRGGTSAGGGADDTGAGATNVAGGGTASSGAAGVGGAAGNASSAPDLPCPTGATFCSGFEGDALPAGARFHAVGPSSENAYAFDTVQHFAGQKSLAITQGSGGFYYRALAVPVPGQNFWVRLYVRVSSVFGDGSHDSLFGASTGGLDADVNNEALVEFSEQFDKVLLNTDDQLFTPTATNTLAPDAWHCLEAHYDGASGDVQVFADGKEIINAPGYAKRSFQSFRIGYMQYNDARAIWYDNVVVAPSRVNCE